MTTSEKVAYLKGLAEGLGLDNEKKEDKLFAAIIDILEDMALDIEDIEENALDLGEEIDELSDDLEELEDIIYDEEEEKQCCGSHKGGHGKHCGEHHSHDDDEECCGCEDDDSPIFFELQCPECGNEITIDEDVLALGSITCPNCDELLEFDLENIEIDDDDDELSQFIAELEEELTDEDDD
jgi:hypothetical protein